MKGLATDTKSTSANMNLATAATEKQNHPTATVTPSTAVMSTMGPAIDTKRTSAVQGGVMALSRLVATVTPITAPTTYAMGPATSTNRT